MSTDTTTVDTATDLREEISATLLAAIDAKPDDLDERDRRELADLTAALMRVFARHREPATWTEPLVRDVTTAVMGSLQLSGVPAGRKSVERALAAAGIEPGEVR
jgi:hypothetical protein